MGIVYEGYDPVIDRIVAIKTIKKDEFDQEEAEEHSRRFLIEAKAAGRLNHKNIVGIYDYGEEKGLSFIVMEFVQGKELKSFFAARHPFSMSQIARLMGELLDALGYSHARGVVHRDVKPDNIFITNDGSVKLGDFGIARIDSTSKTHAGTVLGTPSYMAPEQIRGETADARSDLYAVGVILYQFLVGERPFSGGMVAVMQKVLTEMPKAPSAHNPSIPATIDNVVLRALAKAAGDRFASAAEFNRDLTAAVGLSNDEDESESTMIMSPAALKALQDGPAERTGTGTGSTHTGTGTGGTGQSMVGATGGRAGAVEEAKRRAEEAKRRYEEDLRKAEAELAQAEAEQQAAEAQAQAQAATWMESSQALLAESTASREAGEALFARHALLVDGPASATAGRELAGRLRDSAQGIAQFVEASYALTPATQTELGARQEQLVAAATAHETLAARIDREGTAALSGFEQKLEVLEKRLAGQDGAWSAESRALEALSPDAGEAPIAAIQGRLDKLASSVEQVGKGFASIQAQPLKLPTKLAERVAVIEAQLQAQGSHVARLRVQIDAVRARAKAAVEEAARATAEAEKARKKAEEQARLKAEAEAAAEKKRLADEEAARQAEAARKAAEAQALEKQRREAEERARLQAEAKARSDAEAAEKKRAAEAEATERAAAEAKKQAAADSKRVADEEAARAAKAEADAQAARKKAEAEAAAEKKRLADEQARQKAEAEAKAREKAAKEKAAFEAKRQADEAAARQAAVASLKNADADATLVAPIVAAQADDAETTVVRPNEVKPPVVQVKAAPTPTPTPAPAPAPTPVPDEQAPGKNKLLLPIVGVAVVAIAAGAWFATRPSAPAADNAAASAPVVATSASAVAEPASTAPVAASTPVVVAQADAASAPAAASQPAADDAATQKESEDDAQKKADAEAARQAKADAAAQRKLDAASQAGGKPAVDPDAEAKAKAQLKAEALAKARSLDQEVVTPPVKPPRSDPKADAADMFRKGYEAYLTGNVPEGVRMMERADAMGAQGARARLCAIYRKPTAAEGKDFLKEANKCKGVD